MQTRSTALTLLLIISLISTPLLMEAGAQTAINVQSTTFDKTTIIELENESDKKINQVRIWLAQDVKVESFKNEQGWTGKQNSIGVIIFTASTPIDPEETVKFGIKTDTANPKINWKALDSDENQIGIGTVQSAEPDVVPPKIETPPKEDIKEEQDAITEASSFRIIPDKPKVGDAIRVVGTDFAPNVALDFYIDGTNALSFETNSKGNFVITSKIPDNLAPSRINFQVKDSSNNEKMISLRINEKESRITTEEIIPLTMKGLPDIIHRGDALNIAGTAMPGSTITAQILDPLGDIITTEPRPVNMEGVWEFSTIVPQDAPYGKYTAIITDGSENIDASWEVESSKIIEMAPTTLKYEPGDLMIFNGTAIPEEPIEFVLENPQGVEIFSDIIQVNKSGNVEFRYQTEQSTQEGTYVLFATQRESTEILLTGLGELPREHIVIKLDKLNYKRSDIANIHIDGPAGATLGLFIIDSSDNAKFSGSVVLQQDGKLEYKLDLDKYASGVYDIILSRANTKTSEKFSVGLKIGSGEINIGTTKDTYEINDPILVLGQTNPNVLITLQLINPNGEVVKEKETFTDKNGRITEGSFRVPSDGISGAWQVKATSGSNFDTTELDVIATVQEGMVLTIEGIKDVPEIGKDVVNLRVTGAQNTVKILILDSESKEIDELTFQATDAGVIRQPWPIPRDLSPGTYTVIASDAFDSSTAQFILK